MEVKERIKAILNHYQLSVNEFVEATGIKTAQAVYDLMSGKTKTISKDKEIKILSCYPKINKSWLLAGEGEMFTDAESLPSTIGEAYYTYLLPQYALGGSLVDFGADGVFPQDCERIVSPIADVDFAITIYGDSMTPEYPQGSTILIKRINPDAFIAWGNVYVLDTVNGVIIKEVQPSANDAKVICHSHNPNGRYKDFEVSLADVRGIYRVLACVTAK